MSVMKNIVPKKLFKMLKKLSDIAQYREEKRFKDLHHGKKLSHSELRGEKFSDLEQWTRGYQQALEDVSNAVHYDDYPKVLEPFVDRFEKELKAIEERKENQ